MLSTAVTTILVYTFVAMASAWGQATDPCPMRIQVTKSGEFFTNRFFGHYRTSLELLDRDLKSGCYNDSNPARVSSVTVTIEPGAPSARIALLYRKLDQDGWPMQRIKVAR